jgi:hypothetical protein
VQPSGIAPGSFDWVMNWFKVTHIRTLNKKCRPPNSSVAMEGDSMSGGCKIFSSTRRPNRLLVKLASELGRAIECEADSSVLSVGELKNAKTCIYLFVTSLSGGSTLHPVVQAAVNDTCIPVSTTLFPSGGVCCLGRRVSAHVWHLQVRFLVTVL